MKKFLFIAIAFCFVITTNAQTDSLQPTTPATDMIADTTRPLNNTSTIAVAPPEKKPRKKYNLTNRANDHFLVQIGYTGWLDAPDSIQTKGFSRSINAYFMFDFPFKTTPKLSAAIGLGVGSDHIFLDNNFADVKGSTNTLRFNDTTNLDIKKTKVVTSYLEAPVELRFVADPEHSDKSFKVALGVKVGTMIKGGTRSRITEPGSTPNYLLKEASKNYFNTTRIVGIGRIGMGHFTLFGAYQFTNVLKTGAGPAIRPYTIGLSLGGL